MPLFDGSTVDDASGRFQLRFEDILGEDYWVLYIQNLERDKPFQHVFRLEVQPQVCRFIKKFKLLHQHHHLHCRFKDIDHSIESFTQTCLLYQRGEDVENHFMSKNPIVIKKVKCFFFAAILQF